jgi:hypothetical protein
MCLEQWDKQNNLEQRTEFEGSNWPGENNNKFKVLEIESGKKKSEKSFITSLWSIYNKGVKMVFNEWLTDC